MKIVQDLSNADTVVDLSKASLKRYYGVKFWNGNSRCFITARNFCDGYTVRETEFLTKGNGYQYNSSDLILLIKELLNNRHKVYEFDTAKELFEWLVE